MAADPLQIWAVSDGRAGMASQVLGLAEAVARLTPATIIEKHIAWRPPLGRAPTWALRLLGPGQLAGDADPIVPPWPDLWIAAGRATLPLSIKAKQLSGGRSFVVQTQDPRLALPLFDLVVPPEHDGLSGPNVFPIAGSPHRVTPERLAAHAGRFDSLPRPRVAVLVGGKSRAHDLPPEVAERMGDQIAAAVRAAGGSILVTFSRRTPAAARAALSGRLTALPGLVWDGQGENPYFAILAAADAILVTEDSTNMVAEAASTGQPVHILPMAGHGQRIASFHEALQARGVARPFEGRLENWSYAPLAETDRAAAEIVRRLSR